MPAYLTAGGDGGGFGGSLGLPFPAGYYGGRVDALIMRFTDMQLASFMLLALALVTVLGLEIFNVILVLAVIADQLRWRGDVRKA